jgi:hypothetical protein
MGQIMSASLERSISWGMERVGEGAIRWKRERRQLLPGMGVMRRLLKDCRPGVL